jgi:hypothetical protein
MVGRSGRFSSAPPRIHPRVSDPVPPRTILGHPSDTAREMPWRKRSPQDNILLQIVGNCVENLRRTALDRRGL